jgi:hypothetical protein
MPTMRSTTSTRSSRSGSPTCSLHCATGPPISAQMRSVPTCAAP